MLNRFVKKIKRKKQLEYELSDEEYDEEGASSDEESGDAVAVHNDKGMKRVQSSLKLHKTPATPSTQSAKPQMNVKDINEKFEQLLDELNFPAPKRESMMKVSTERKMQLLKQYQNLNPAVEKSKIDVKQFIEPLKKGPSLQLLKDLHLNINSQSTTWIHQFISSQGCEALFSALQAKRGKKKKSKEDKEIQKEIVYCIKCLMNNKTGLKRIISIRHSITYLGLCLEWKDVKTRTLILELLTTVCILPHGHKLVLKAMNTLKEKGIEKREYALLLSMLRKSKSMELKLSCMTFINALVNSPSDVDVRVHLRNNLERVGIKKTLSILNKELSHGSDGLYLDLEIQVNMYEEEAKCDEEDLQDRIQDLDCKFDDPEDVFQSLLQRAESKGLHNVLLTMMQYMLLIPIEEESGVKCWALAERLIQQVALNKTSIALDDYNDVKVSLESISRGVDNAGEVHALNKEIERLEDLVRNYKNQKGNVESKDDNSVVLQKLQRNYDDAKMAANEWEMKAHKNAKELVQLQSKFSTLQKQMDTMASGPPPPPTSSSATSTVPLPTVPITTGLPTLPPTGGSAVGLPPLPTTGQPGGSAVGLPPLPVPGGSAVGLPPLPVPGQPVQGGNAVGLPPLPGVNGTQIGGLPPLPVPGQEGTGGLPPLPVPGSEGTSLPTLPALPQATGTVGLPSLPVLPGGPPGVTAAPSLPALPYSGPPSGGDVAVVGGGPPAPGEAVVGGGPPAPGEAAVVGGGPPPPPGGGPPPPPGGGPPPPPGGGPPPPGGGPPVPGAGPAAVAGRKCKRPPKIKLKGYQWACLPQNKLENSMWSKLDKNKHIQFEFGEIENIFAAAKTKKMKRKGKGNDGGGASAGPSGGGAEGEGGEVKANATFLNSKKGRNIGIMLGRLKLSNSQIKSAILSMSDNIIDDASLKIIFDFMPDRDEYEQISNFVNTQSAKFLAGPERFFWEMGQIPNFPQRIKFQLFKQSFHEKSAALTPDLVTMKKVSKDVKSSHALERLMEIVLLMGNFINAGTFRGGAFGFKLNGLLKLRDTKGKDGTTLMQYLVQWVDKNEPQLVQDFLDDLSRCTEAARVSLPTIRMELKTLTEGITELGETLDTVEKAGSSDRFHSVMKKFHETGLKTVTMIKKEFDEALALFQKVGEYYGEENPDPEEFFGILGKFRNDFAKIKKDAEMKRKLKERELKRAAAAEKRKLELAIKRAAIKKHKEDTGAASEEEEEDLDGCVDNVIEKLRTGNREQWKLRRNAPARKPRQAPENGATDFRSMLRKAPVRKPKIDIPQENSARRRGHHSSRRNGKKKRPNRNVALDAMADFTT